MAVPNGGWLEDIEVTQRIHPSMLDKDGRFTLTVSVQYHNVGTEENPEWVKTFGELHGVQRQVVTATTYTHRFPHSSGVKFCAVDAPARGIRSLYRIRTESP